LNLRVREDFTLDGLVDEAIENMLSTNNLVNFGIPQLDDLTGGMTKGEITVIAGRPGHFKTTTMINVVKKLIDDGKKVLVFNREMSNVEMMKKIIILESETLSYGNMRMGHFDDEANLDLDKAKEIVKE
jgi:replicative DNA helicase